MRPPDSEQWRLGDHLVGWFSDSNARICERCMVVAMLRKVRVVHVGAYPTLMRKRKTRSQPFGLIRQFRVFVPGCAWAIPPLRTEYRVPFEVAVSP